MTENYILTHSLVIVGILFLYLHCMGSEPLAPILLSNQPSTKNSDITSIFEYGCKLYQSQQFQDSVEQFKYVQKKAPSFAQAYFNCGLAFKQLEKHNEAVEQFEHAISCSPCYIKALVYAGIEYNYLKNTEMAIKRLECAATLDPACSQAHFELASLYTEQENFSAAEPHLRQLIDLKFSGDIEMAFACSNLFLNLGKPEDTIAILEKLNKDHPQNASIIQNLSFAYKITGQTSKALELLQEILRDYPDRDSTHFALGHTLLSLGDFEHGWKQHDRFLLNTSRYSKELKEWVQQGSLKNKTILIRQEGGIGDMIQWIRCAQQLKDMGATIIVTAPEAILKLLSRCRYLDTIIPCGQKYSTVPHFDAHVTVMSLPAVLELQEFQMATTIPYIFPDPSLIAQWEQTLRPDKQFKVGLCWQADMVNDSRRLPFARRGIPLEKLSSIGSIPGISFYSLQKHDGIDQIDAQKDKLNIHLFGDDFDNSHGGFMDTAAVMYHLDLIITVDTAIAHLAGALGKCVWLLLPYQTDWRWIHGRTDSPWYPTMRIFKQQNPFDWDPIIDQIQESLSQLATHT